MCLVYNKIKNVKNSYEIVHFMLLLRWISFSWFEQNIENGKRYRHVQKLFYHSKGKQCIPFSYTVFKGDVNSCQKLKKLIFKLNMANPVNMLYSELLSQQRAI